MSSFTKDNEAYLRSKGYSGTRFDSPRDNDLVEKNKFLYDSIVKAAGDDGKLTNAEYETIYSGDRGPWGKYAYNQDSVADSLARAAVDSGFKIDQETLDRHDLAYDGDDVMAKIEGGDFAPSIQDKDKYSYERTIDDDDDRWNVFRYKANTVAADPDPVVPDDPDPVVPDDPDPFNPDPVVPPVTTPDDPDPVVTGTTIPEPKIGGYGGEFEDSWNPSGRRLGVDLTPNEQMGSIPFVTSSQYNNRYKTGRFSDFLNNRQSSNAVAKSLISSMWDDA